MRKGVLFIFFIFIIKLNAQVLPDQFLVQSHSGILEESVNYPERPLPFSFDFVSSKNEVLKLYQLNFYKKNNTTHTFDLQIRNLIITCYFEIKMKDQNGKIKTLTAVYDKGNKWLRVKFAPTQSCAREKMRWERLNNVASFDEILEHIVRQIDKNLMLDCYR